MNESRTRNITKQRVSSPLGNKPTVSQYNYTSAISKEEVMKERSGVQKVAPYEITPRAGGTITIPDMPPKSLGTVSTTFSYLTYVVSSNPADSTNPNVSLDLATDHNALVGVVTESAATTTKVDSPVSGNAALASAITTTNANVTALQTYIKSTINATVDTGFTLGVGSTSSTPIVFDGSATVGTAITAVDATGVITFVKGGSFTMLLEVLATETTGTDGALVRFDAYQGATLLGGRGIWVAAGATDSTIQISVPNLNLPDGFDIKFVIYSVGAGAIDLTAGTDQSALSITISEYQLNTPVVLVNDGSVNVFSTSKEYKHKK